LTLSPSRAEPVITTVAINLTEEASYSDALLSLLYLNEISCIFGC